MKRSKAIIWGGTGNFRVLCELLQPDFEVIGFFDNNPEVEAEYRGIRHLGNEVAFRKWIAAWEEQEKPAFIVSIGPGRGAVRLRIHEDLKAAGLQPITAIHRTAFVADNAVVAEGSQIYAGALVCVDARIGKCCIVNTGATIDHECILEDGATVGPGANLAGVVTVGRHADVYTGAVVLPRITIGENATVGAGAVVIKNVPAGVTVVGNPARRIK